jgi:hypothetical protein
VSGELTLAPGHDPLSSLIKETVKLLKTDFRTSGNGAQDLHNLLVMNHNSATCVQEYEKAFKIIMNYLLDQKLGEDHYGYCAAALLSARVNIDLKKKQ